MHCFNFCADDGWVVSLQVWILVKIRGLQESAGGPNISYASLVRLGLFHEAVLPRLLNGLTHAITHATK